ncbi:Sulfotransferase family protein [Tistlia consotensis]|uniref:Sulfotransferase family protein n=1 Tax=Tistlia consotensis USBA 355 TaxID=560819 RepID=A0A1Y6CWK5_9PROT|nr:sulfotransferase [Tistlia consotensis]SMF80097.1 Sulfotransferase family protein [Tistlia consotensis USBA 355]SNR62157.1 Sulfotransferase family protein [Tistlia consotensis]
MSLPLILVSQQSRSGGTLFSQLLDAHPALLVHPHELTIGWPSKIRWPEIDPDDDPDRLFRQISNPRLASLAELGYRKTGKAAQAGERVPFCYDRNRHLQAFRAELPAPPRSRRAVIDAYLDSLFRVWRRNSRTGRPSYYAGFVPELGSKSASVEQFFADYPRGRLVSIVRDPADWLVSRRAHTKGGEQRHSDLEREMALWNKMARAARRHRRHYRERFFLLRFERLVDDRERVMRHFAAWAGVDWSDRLLEPTFDGQPVAANTNFNSLAGVSERRLVLPPGELERVRALTRAEAERLEPAFSV